MISLLEPERVHDKPLIIGQAFKKCENAMIDINTEGHTMEAKCTGRQSYGLSTLELETMQQV